MRYPWKKRIKSLAFVVFSLCQCPRRNRLCLYLNLIELIALIVLDLRVKLARRSQTIESLSLSLSLFF